MPKTASTTELRKMSAADLQKEISAQRGTVAKLRIGVETRSHKDTAQYRREKKALARLLTVLNQVEGGAAVSEGTALKAKRKTSKVSASKSSTASK